VVQNRCGNYEDEGKLDRAHGSVWPGRHGWPALGLSSRSPGPLAVVSARPAGRAGREAPRGDGRHEGDLGAQSLFVGLWTAGLGTARNHPYQYGPHWDGFAKRYGIRFSGVAASNTIEAGLGAIWGEDPRYVRNALLPFKKRIGNVFWYSLMARNRNGRLMPAYARYIAIPGNNFLSNTWRVGSDATTSAALARTGYGILSVVAGNAWYEFWPDLKGRFFNK